MAPGRGLRTALSGLTDPGTDAGRGGGHAGERGLDPGGEAIDRCEAVVQILEDGPDPPDRRGRRAASASPTAISTGSSSAVTGLSPRALSRILRLRALLASLDVYAPVNWTALAAGFGWFDQSHLIRDFKRHTGVTPSEYVAAQRAAFTPEQAAPGFVPR